jgi:hypothetical protein
MELLEKPRLPDLLTKAVCWIVGEYAYLGQADFDQVAVIEVVTSLLDRPATDNLDVRGWILAALVKLVSQTGLFPDALRVRDPLPPPTPPLHRHDFFDTLQSPGVQG